MSFSNSLCMITKECPHVQCCLVIDEIHHKFVKYHSNEQNLMMIVVKTAVLLCHIFCITLHEQHTGSDMLKSVFEIYWVLWFLGAYYNGEILNIDIDRLMQERRNSIAKALELRLALTHWYLAPMTLQLILITSILILSCNITTLYHNSTAETLDLRQQNLLSTPGGYTCHELQLNVIQAMLHQMVGHKTI